MGANFLSAVAIQYNNDVYMNDGYTPGQTVTNVPTPSLGGLIDGDYWAVPVNDGVNTGFNYSATSPTSTDKPDVQAFHVVRISSTNSPDRWWLFGTSTEYAIASNTVECCGDSSPNGVMPTNVPSIAPCQVICADEDGVYTAVLGVPGVLGEGEAYYPFGYFNGEALAQAAPAGYDSVAALVAFLNGDWRTGALTDTWTASVDGLTITNTLDDTATGTDVLCAAIVKI